MDRIVSNVKFYGIFLYGINFQCPAINKGHIIQILPLDLLTAVMICLGDPEDNNYDGILKLLNVLLSSEKKPEEKKRILQEDFAIRMTKELESGVTDVCNLSKGIEEKGIAIGMERGLKAGMEAGMEQGMEAGMLQAIKNLMDTLKLTAEQAMEALKVPKEEKVKYAGMLKG